MIYCLSYSSTAHLVRFGHLGHLFMKPCVELSTLKREKTKWPCTKDIQNCMCITFSMETALRVSEVKCLSTYSPLGLSAFLRALNRKDTVHTFPLFMNLHLGYPTVPRNMNQYPLGPKYLKPFSQTKTHSSKGNNMDRYFGT